MSEQVLQVNFKFGVEASEYEELAASLAQAFSEVPGLVWKIWILNRAEREAGGFYYFDSTESMQRFLGSQLAADVQAHPAIRDFSAKTFEVLRDVTTVTRGPVEALAVPV